MKSRCNEMKRCQDRQNTDNERSLNSSNERLIHLRKKAEEKSTKKEFRRLRYSEDLLSQARRKLEVHKKEKAVIEASTAEKRKKDAESLKTGFRLLDERPGGKKRKRWQSI